MNILFIHQNFPGQFRHLAGYLADNPQNRVVAISQAHAPGHPKVTARVIYKPTRKSSANTHHYLRGMEGAVLNGQAVAKSLLKLQKQGFVPDLIIAHPAWGEALYVKDIFPTTPLLSHFEFYYHADGADVNFDPEYPLDLDGRLRIRTRNALHLLNLEACDAGVSPTYWQKSLHPAEFHSRISVIHEGIDTKVVAPNPHQSFTLPNGKVLTQADEVITYVSRNLEPYRGFHIFMRAVEKICKRRPNAQIVIVGGDDVSYGVRLANDQTYREKMLGEVSIDPSRVSFTGKLPYAKYLALLQVSSAHIYLTVPFVLSWSMLEAMSAGCLVIGSNTPPVREVLKHGENGLLVDFFSPEQIADAVDEVFSYPDRMQALRDAARRTIVEGYEVRQSLMSYWHLINGANGNGLISKYKNRYKNEAAIRSNGEVIPSLNLKEIPNLNGVSSQHNIQVGNEAGVTQIMVPMAAEIISAASKAGTNTSIDSEIKVNKNVDLNMDGIGLSPREMEILRHLALGKGDKIIADNLQISVKTVNHHVSSIMLKLDAANRTHAVSKALMAMLIKMRSTDTVSGTHKRRLGERADKANLNS